MRIQIIRPELLDANLARLQTMRFLKANGYDAANRKFFGHAVYPPGDLAAGVPLLADDILSRGTSWLKWRWVERIPRFGRWAAKRKLVKLIRNALRG